MSPKGEKLETEIYEAVIQSKRRATYNQIEQESLSNLKNPNWKFKPHFELYEILRKMREERGSIDFDLPEVEIKVDETGDPTEINRRDRLGAHRLIEEFMIAANESVTEWMLERKLPFIYRVHGEPAAESLERFRKLAATVGFKFELKEEGVPPLVLANIARKMKGHTAELLLNTSLLRSMRQATYSAEHGIHYGLASEAYTHFTSPIRRYPDLIVHRELRRALRAEKEGKHMSNSERQKIEETLAESAEHCSYRERLATEAERESNKLKQVRFLAKLVGDEFEGIVIGMMERGLFIQLRQPFVEGMVPKDSMNDDFYEFNEERMVFYGKRKKRTFKIGDPVWIKVVRADIERRQVDFALIDAPSES
jgi:ribonuclease R